MCHLIFRRFFHVLLNRSWIFGTNCTLCSKYNVLFKYTVNPKYIYMGPYLWATLYTYTLRRKNNKRILYQCTCRYILFITNPSKIKFLEAIMSEPLEILLSFCQKMITEKLRNQQNITLYENLSHFSMASWHIRFGITHYSLKLQYLVVNTSIAALNTRKWTCYFRSKWNFDNKMHAGS